MLSIHYVSIMMWIVYTDWHQHWKCDWTMNISANAHGKRTVSIGSLCCVCCGDLHKLPFLWRHQRWWSLVTLGCTQVPNGIGPLVYNEGNHQLKTPNFVENWPIFTTYISYPNNFFFTKSFRRLHSHLKNISWFSQKYYGPHFMAICSCLLC